MNESTNIGRKIMLMLRELHMMGYEKLRLISSVSPSGACWRFAILPVTKVSRLNGAMASSFDFRADASGSFDGSERCTGAGDSENDSPRKIAELFLSRFPEIAAEGLGQDKDYVDWYKNVIRETEPQDLIYAHDDYYDSDCDGYLRTVIRQLKIPMPPAGKGSPHDGCMFRQKDFQERINASPALSAALEELLREEETANSIYEANLHANKKTYPIPFFGDPESARIVTIGVNPSATEFVKRRKWPKTMDVEDLESRLRLYFKLFSIPPHPWFTPYERTLNSLGCSYKTDAAHLDLSPRATVSMCAVKDRALFLDMVAKDTAKWFVTFLDFCSSARFLLMCGSVTNKYYIHEFLAKHLPPGYEIEGDLKRITGFGETGWFRRLKLITPKRTLPVLFFSKSPSSRNKETLLDLVIEKNKDNILSYLYGN